MFLLIYKNLGIAIFQTFSKRNRKATNLSIPFEVRETSLPLFIFVTFHAKTYTNGFPFTSRYSGVRTSWSPFRWKHQPVQTTWSPVRYKQFLFENMTFAVVASWWREVYMQEITV